MSRPASHRVATHWALGSILAALLVLLAALDEPASKGSSGSVAPTSTATAEPAVVAPLPMFGAPTSTPPAALARLALPSSSGAPSGPLSVQAPPRVGIQIGHWLADEVPEELEAIRTVGGVLVGDWDETVISEQIGRLLRDMLTSEGVVVDILPTTVPQGYSADLFISLHVDAYRTTEMSGFKIARSHWSQDPERDDSLVEKLINHYGASTGLPEHRDTLTDAMTEYYAFNHEKFQHSVSPSTPAVIIEMGFLSNEADRQLLIEDQGRIARTLFEAVIDFVRGSSEQ